MNEFTDRPTPSVFLVGAFVLATVAAIAVTVSYALRGGLDDLVGAIVVGGGSAIFSSWWFWRWFTTEYRLSAESLDLRSGNRTATLPLREIWGIREVWLPPFVPFHNYGNRMYGGVVVRVGDDVFRLTPSRPAEFVFRVDSAARAASDVAIAGSPAEDQGVNK